MKEALRREGAKFEGVVGTPKNESTSNDSKSTVKFEVAKNARILVMPDESSSRDGASAGPAEIILDTWELWRPTTIERPFLVPRGCFGE